jgi:chemotaxis methyl-accepting protein methylase
MDRLKAEVDGQTSVITSQQIKVAVLGCSTGEECVRIFWELTKWEGENNTNSTLKICGIDLERGVVAEARRRVSGTRALQGAYKNRDSDYARGVISGINHDSKLHRALRDSVVFVEGDITKADTLAGLIGGQPDLIFLNHTLRLFGSAAQKEIFGALSTTFKDAIIAVGDPDTVIDGLIIHGGYEHLLVRPEIREGVTAYAFGVPFWTNEFLPGLWEGASCSTLNLR